MLAPISACRSVRKQIIWSNPDLTNMGSPMSGTEMGKKLNRLKVSELREECERLGLDAKGTKAVLVDKILKAQASRTEEVRVAACHCGCSGGLDRETSCPSRCIQGHKTWQSVATAVGEQPGCCLISHILWDYEQ